jgi:ABC-type multidrug transport system fused ATPase/permease subunit
LVKCVLGDRQKLPEESMDKRIRDRIKKIEKLEMDLLSDEEILTQKKEITLLIEALQQELLRRTIVIGAVIIAFVIAVVGLFSYPSTPMLFVTLVSLLAFIMLVIIYTQKLKMYNDLYKAADILYK